MPPLRHAQSRSRPSLTRLTVRNGFTGLSACFSLRFSVAAIVHVVTRAPNGRLKVGRSVVISSDGRISRFPTRRATEPVTAHARGAIVAVPRNSSVARSLVRRCRAHWEDNRPRVRPRLSCLHCFSRPGGDPRPARHGLCVRAAAMSAPSVDGVPSEGVAPEEPEVCDALHRRTGG